MVGFEMPPRYSYLLNRWDVIGVVAVVGRVLYLWYHSGLGWSLITDDLSRFLSFLFALVLNFMSEQDRGYTYYLPLHSTWHLSIFLILNGYLKVIYGK
jgi:hypothetical protein